MIIASFCLENIPDTAKKVSNGKTWVNICIQNNFNNEVDQFGNTHNITISQSKEERENKVKKCYIGNGKEYTFAPKDNF